ncbi:MAG: D-glycero-beta-D-manno-heptose 1-phosphate adenylyltransferase [Planctomycetia bacterium]|nr:D-glycero-beta-D-manno-heptose 1-phosphate adenylyltransferase [Planctomycetia bacterium]
MPPTDLIPLFAALGRPRVLVLGDLILDRYTWGNAERVSQEAPVILLRADEREARLGGAANVCNMLRGLEAEVTCAGIVGQDLDGRLVRRMLRDLGIDDSLVMFDEERPTTVKERFIGRAQGRHPHQILRVDSEVRDPLRADLAHELSDRILAELERFDVVLISDYDKGVCAPRLLRAVIDAARTLGKPVIVDPIRGSDYSRYRGATTMTPNRSEAAGATGIEIKTHDDAIRAGWKLCRELKLDFGIVTLDRDGMALVAPEGRGEVYPTQARAVYDITGAGDMVLAMIGVCFAAGVEPADAVRLANVAGGLEVEKVGCTPIPRREIMARLAADRAAGTGKVVALPILSTLVAAHRAAGQKIVFTNGCFDLLHVGHVTYLQEAAQLGDILIVGVNSDASVRRLKGPTRPVIGAIDRSAILAALGCVAYVVNFDDDTPRELIATLRPEVLVKGGAYKREEIVGYDIVESYGGQVCIAGMVDGISTSHIVEALNQTALNQPTGSKPAIPAPHFQVGQPIQAKTSSARLHQ